jgi:hypothetical protein
MSRGDRARIGLGMGLALLLLVIPLVSEEGTSPPERPRLAGEADGPMPTLPHGELLGLDEARAAFPVPLDVPETEIASTSTLESVWVRLEDPPEAFLTFASGVRMVVEPSSNYPASLEEIAAAQTADGVPGVIQQIDGRKAFVVAPDPPTSLGSVKLVLEDTTITIVGDGILSKEQLFQVAASAVDQHASD